MTDEQMAEVVEIGGVAEEPEAEPEAEKGGFESAYDTAVRFAAGVTGVITQRMRDATELASPDREGIVVSEDPEPGAVLFGFAADLPTRLHTVTTAVEDGSGFVRSVAGFGWKVTMASPVGWLIAKPVDAARREAERLAEIGRQEIAQGRIVFDRFVDTTIDQVLSNVSESNALNELIRDQALGVGGAAIQEVRETGAAADSLTDSLVRRVLRREPRALPPVPAGEVE